MPVYAIRNANVAKYIEENEDPNIRKKQMRGLKKAEKHLIKWFVIKGSVMKKLISIAALSVLTAVQLPKRHQLLEMGLQRTI